MNVRLIAASVLLLAGAAGAQDFPFTRPEIDSVSVDSAAGRVTVHGDHFQDRPDLMLSDRPLTLLQASDHVLVAALPQGLAPGSYRLEVHTGRHQWKSDRFDLTIGAAGAAGPQGAQGLQGPQGPQGLPGAAGAAGLPGLSCWDLNQDNVCEPSEDVNGNGFCEVQDCRGATGPKGDTGPQGPEGPAGATAEAAPEPTPLQGDFILRIGSHVVALPKAAAGGAAVVSPSGAVTYQDIVVRFDPFSISSPDMRDWLQRFMTGTQVPVDGDVIAYDSLRSAADWPLLQFRGATISKLEFPALDAAQQDAGLLTMTIRVGSTSYRKGSPSTALPKASANWILSNFTLDLDGQDASSVSQVGGVAFTQAYQADGSSTPAGIPVPSILAVTSQQNGKVGDWLAWYKAEAEGYDGQPHPVNGRLSFLSRDLATKLGALDFQAQVKTATPLAPFPTSTHSSTQGPSVETDLYISSVTFTTP